MVRPSAVAVSRMSSAARWASPLVRHLKASLSVTAPSAFGRLFERPCELHAFMRSCCELVSSGRHRKHELAELLVRLGAS